MADDKKKEQENTEKDDPVVVEEEPVVDVEEDDAEATKEARNNKIKYIVIVVSVLISVLVYLFIFSSNGKDDMLVDNTAIVKDEQDIGKVNSSPTIDNIDSLADIGYQGDVFVNNNEKEVLELPELPELPANITNSISEEVKEVKEAEEREKGFSKAEVDEMINEKLKSFESEMNKLRDESKKLAEELEKKKKEEEENKKNKRFPIFSSKDNQNTSDSALPESITGDISPEEISKDPLVAIKEQKKQEEREIQIAQRKRIVEERKGSPMFKMQGGGGGDGSSNDENSIIILDKDSLNSVEETKIDSVTTKTSDMSRTVLQGKIINAVLETAINTDVKTQVRAVVSRDVYSESGKNIVIPKGSKVVGNFQAITSNNISRIQITWTRIIRVDGLSINITADSADNLGRGGVDGDLDNKYMQTMKNTVLSSLISIAGAVLLDKVTNTVNTTQTTTGLTGTTTTTTSNASSQAIIDATQNITDEMQDIVDNLKEETPTIRVAQGTKINIIVNQDMNLPIYKQND